MGGGSVDRSGTTGSSLIPLKAKSWGRTLRVRPRFLPLGIRKPPLFLAKIGSKHLLFNDLLQGLFDVIAIDVGKRHFHGIPFQRWRQPQVDLLALLVGRRRLDQVDRADLALAGRDALFLDHLEGPWLGITAAGHEESPFRTGHEFFGRRAGYADQLPDGAVAVLLAALERIAVVAFAKDDGFAVALEGGGRGILAETLFHELRRRQAIIVHRAIAALFQDLAEQGNLGFRQQRILAIAGTPGADRLARQGNAALLGLDGVSQVSRWRQLEGALDHGMIDRCVRHGRRHGHGQQACCQHLFKRSQRFHLFSCYVITDGNFGDGLRRQRTARFSIAYLYRIPLQGRRQPDIELRRIRARLRWPAQMPGHQAAHLGIDLFLSHQLEAEHGRLRLFADLDIDIAGQLVHVAATDGSQLERHAGLVLRPWQPGHGGRAGRKGNGFLLRIEVRGRLRAPLAFFRRRDGHDTLVIYDTCTGQYQQIDACDQHTQAYFQLQLVVVALILPRHGRHAFPFGAIGVAPVHLHVKFGRSGHVDLVMSWRGSRRRCRLRGRDWFWRSCRYSLWRRRRNDRCRRRHHRAFRDIAGGRRQFSRHARWQRRFQRWRRWRRPGLGLRPELWRRRRCRRHRQGLGWRGDQFHVHHARDILRRTRATGVRSEPIERQQMQHDDHGDKDDGTAARRRKEGGGRHTASVTPLTLFLTWRTTLGISFSVRKCR